jgi:hypothetical protein
MAEHSHPPSSHGLNAVYKESIGGYAPPLDYTRDELTVITCFFVVSIKNGACAGPHGAAYLCQPSVPGTSC